MVQWLGNVFTEQCIYGARSKKPKICFFLPEGRLQSSGGQTKKQKGLGRVWVWFGFGPQSQ